MLQAWRWFGPRDPISLTKVRQAGASCVVTALHDVEVGEVWTREAIAKRCQELAAAGLSWGAVESLPVHASIRLQESGFERCLENYLHSLENLAACGVRVVCYNFMPVIDWTRTDLEWTAADGSRALRFDATRWAAFDLYVLERPGAEQDYDPAMVERAGALAASMTESQKDVLVRAVAAGLPGANEEGYCLGTLKEALARWSLVSPRRLRDNLVAFLERVTPTAERLGLRLCIHPDDPPRPLLGLPRVASCGQDFHELFERVPSPANALTLCVGSLGAGRKNDPLALASTFASRIHFAHLRAVATEDDGSFVEANHLEGDVDLVAIVRELVIEERRRAVSGEPFTQIVIRPDHGRVLEGDIAELPGYSWLGRLKGLAELRGVITAVERLVPER